MHVLVLGGYGLIGLSASLRLAAAGHRISGMGRSVRSARISYPEIAWIERDIAKLVAPTDWLPLLSGIDAVVNCSGALQDSARDNLQALQSDAMKALFSACQMASVDRFVQVSAAGVSPLATTRFFKTKAEADAALAASELSWIILRPGLVISSAAYGGTALLRGLASFPFVLPLASGAPLLQTVNVDDVADAVVAATEGRVPSRASYDLVEDHAHSLPEVVSAFRSWLGRPPVLVLQLPRRVASLVLGVGDILSHLGWRPPLRTTVLLQLESGIAGDPSAWREARGRNLSGLRDTLRRYPSTIQERWFGRLWLLKPLVIATLSAFWLASGIIGAWQAEAATRILTQQGIGDRLARTAVVAGSLLDIALALLILVRATHKAAALGMIGVTVGYLAAGTLLAPLLWVDPLGPFIKTLPGAVLALVALAIAEER